MQKPERLTSPKAMRAIFDQGPPQPCPDPFNMAAYVLAKAATRPDKIALAVLEPSGAEHWSYSRLEAAVRGVATGLLQAGLAPGDRLLMRLGNTVEFPIVYLAAITVGIIPVPTSSQLTTAELDRILPDLAPAAIAASPGTSLPSDTPRVLDPTQLNEWMSLPPADFQIGPADRPAYIVYTSGTAGQPRGVVHAHRAVWARRMMFDGWYSLGENDRLLHAGAFNWTYTLGTGFIDPVSVGATALIPSPEVTADILPLLLERHGATIFAAAPGVFRRVLRHWPDRPMPKLRHGLSAGEKLPEATRLAWENATGTSVHEAYGMSECSTFLSGAPAHPAPPGVSGFPQPGRRIAILGEDGTPVEMDQDGEIAVHESDPGLMLGYLNAAAETEARHTGNWFRTGDRARMGADGAIIYLGRADDMMNAGGHRVSPLEVERAFHDVPGIAECAAVEFPVKSDTTVIALFYEAKKPLADADLEVTARKTLAAYKCPRLYRHVAHLPRSANGKISRKLLRQT